MSVDRIVTNLISPSPKRTQQFYADVLGLRPVMDHGWIVTLVDPEHPQAQLSLVSSDATASVVPEVSIQVDDVDRAYELAQQAGAEIVHPLTDEPWGVRRFFVRDPDGHVVNVLSHP